MGEYNVWSDAQTEWHQQRQEEFAAAGARRMDPELQSWVEFAAATPEGERLDMLSAAGTGFKVQRGEAVQKLRAEYAIRRTTASADPDPWANAHRKERELEEAQAIAERYANTPEGADFLARAREQMGY